MLAAQGTLRRGQGPQQLGMVRVPAERRLQELQGLVRALLGHESPRQLDLGGHASVGHGPQIRTTRCTPQRRMVSCRASTM